MTRLLTSLEEIPKTGRCLLLASGGLDSAFCMLWAAEHELDLSCLHVELGDGAGEQVATIAARFGLAAREVDARNRFSEDFVADAIRAGALYQGVYPLSSSLSRPLIAQIAVEEALAIGAETIVHTAAAHQNSYSRFNVSLAAHEPGIAVGAPFLESEISRTEKRESLAAAGVQVSESIHSIDQNLWCRVIENGTLDDSTAAVPESLFVWTRRTEMVPRAVELVFDAGLPTHLDGRRLPLALLLTELNRVVGAQGIGRFNGFEQTPSGMKNHEVREAPAAAVILSAARHLRQVSLPDNVLGTLDASVAEWLHEIVVGRWSSRMAGALRELIAALVEPVSGSVLIRLDGDAFVTGVHPEQSLALKLCDGTLRGSLTYEQALNMELAAL